VAQKRMSWILAILILVAGARGAGGVDRHPLEAKAHQEWTIPREGAKRLDLHTKFGDIRVVGAAVDQLQIHAFKEVGADSQADAQAFLLEMKIDWRREGDRWVIGATWPAPRPVHFDWTRVNFEVRVPRGMEVEARTDIGDIEAMGISKIGLHAHIGNINMEVAPGNALLQVELETKAGNIEVRLPESASTRLTADTGGGSVTFPQPTHARLTRVQGDSHLEAVFAQGEGFIHLHAGTGDIGIQIAPGR
jgi:hypothetical protein